MTQYDLSEMLASEVEEFLGSYQFFTAAYDVTYGEGTEYERSYSYPDEYDSGWDAVENFAHNGYDTPIGRLTLIEQKGGEGQGDKYHIVILLEQGETARTFKMQGWYASHHGHEFDGPFTEVSAKLKTITVWE